MYVSRFMTFMFMHVIRCLPLLSDDLVVEHREAADGSSDR